MTEGKHTFTKTGRQHRATYATICQLIVDAWAEVSVSTVVQAFTKAGIITELPGNSNDTDSDNDEWDMLEAVIAQLLNSDTEDEEFEVFVDKEWTEKVSVLCCILRVITEQFWELLWIR